MTILNKIIALIITIRKIENKQATGWACIIFKKVFFFLKAPVEYGEENEKMQTYVVSFLGRRYGLTFIEYDETQQYHTATFNTELPIRVNKHGIAFGKFISSGLQKLDPTNLKIKNLSNDRFFLF